MLFGKRKTLKSSEICLGSVVLDKNTGRIYSLDGKELELRYQSRDVLTVLAKNPGEVVSHQSLIDTVWSGRIISADSIAQCVSDIRRVLGDANKSIIENVPREGYRLVLPDQTGSAPSRRLQFLPLSAVAILLLVLCTGLFFLLRTGEPTKPPVIAVLPFKDFSVAPNQGYLSDAAAESIITYLARYPQLTVISRRSSFQFRNSDLSITEIAAKLGADFVLEGGQQYDGSRLQITVQLIEAESEAHVWADEIDVPLDELLKTNNQISRKIANAVGFSVIDTAQARVTAGDVSALMIANAAQSRILRNYNRENLIKNLEEQEKAIRDYPNSAWGYLGQALAIRVGLSQRWIEGDEMAARKRMYHLARRGVELDPNNFMAYHALGRVLMFNRDVEAATGAFRRAVELNPSSSLATNGLADSLVYIGKTDEALELLEGVERIDPLYNFALRWSKAWAMWQIEECALALDVYQSAPSMPTAANKVLAAIQYCLGNHDEAAKAMEAYLAENSDWTVDRERADNTGMWTAPGALERWLTAMEATGMPTR